MGNDSLSGNTPVTKGQLGWVIVSEIMVLLTAALQFLNMLTVHIWKSTETGSFIFVLQNLVNDVEEVAERHSQLFKMIGALMLLGIALLVFSALQMNLPLLRGTAYKSYNLQWPIYSVLYMMLGQAATLAILLYRKATIELHFGFWCCAVCELLTLGLLLAALVKNAIVPAKKK